MREFDAGYHDDPFRTLCAEAPGATVYPSDSFRTEWGAVFHRGRLDGSARALVIGQDPAAHEHVARRILVGEAGQRVQGLLGKLGYTKSYVMVNAFLFSVVGKGGEKHAKSAGIAAYRNRWLDALTRQGSQIEVVITFGSFARDAWKAYLKTPHGKTLDLAHAAFTHPTFPESFSKGSKTKHAAAVKDLLANWNKGMKKLKPAVQSPDVNPTFAAYGAAFKPTDLVAIPSHDLPPGLPEWMGSLDAWAWRDGKTLVDKRRTIIVQVPEGIVQ